MSEKILVNRMIKWLNAQPNTHARKVHGGPHGTKGEPDIDACVSGQSLKIEVKLPGRRPTKIQDHRLAVWHGAGAIAGWATTLEGCQDLHSEAMIRAATSTVHPDIVEGWVHDVHPDVAEDWTSS